MSVKKVLITGGNGFLGSNAARELYRRGYIIKLMIRPSADTRSITDLPCEIFYGDIANASDVLQAVEDCAYVVHTASITQPWNISLAEYTAINVTGTRNVAEACLQQGVKKLIHISTANTIGPGTQHKPANELNAFSLFPINSGYINTKYIAEQYILEQVAARQLPAVIINPTFMIGAFDARPSSGRIILYGLHKKVLFYPPGGKNFVHVQDVCRGIANALEIGRHGDCYLLAGENLSYGDFFRLLQQEAQQKSLLIRIPAWCMKLAGLAGTLRAKITGTTPPLHYATAHLLCLYNYYSGKKSERELRVRYTPIRQAVQDALNWYQENHYC